MIGAEQVKDFNSLFAEHKAAIKIATADCEHLSKDYQLPIHSSKEQPGMRRAGNKLDEDKPITDVSAGAKWRATIYKPEDLLRNPLSERWLLQVKGFSHFSRVYDLMHCMDVGAASHCIANMCYDIV